MRNLYFILVLFFSSNLVAQPLYQTSGPAGSGGNCYWIYPEGDLVFVAFNDRLYRSTNGGDSYEVVTTLFDADLSTVRCVGRVGDYIVSATNSADRVYRSADDGLTWEPVFEGLPTIMGFPAAVPTDMYTDGSTLILGGTNFFAMSTDEGASFQPLNGVLGSSTFGIDKVNDNWYICTSANETNLPAYPIFRSTDNGATWNALPAAPETDLGIGNPIAQNTTGITEYEGAIYAITESNAGDALQKSEDNGATWEAVGSFIGGKYIRNIDDVLYVTSFQGLDRSFDGGDTWEEVLGPEYFSFGFHGYMVQEGNKLWVATGQGPVIYDLTTGEVTDSAIPSASIPFVVAADGLIVGLQNGEVTVSNDQGQTYDVINLLISEFFFASSVSINSGTIYVYGSTGQSAGIYFSTDGGASWAELGGLPENDSNGSILSYNPLIYGTGEGPDLTFYRSDDDGASWSEATVTVEGDPLENDAVVQNIEQHGDYLFADITDGFGYSTDGGVSWTVRATDTDAPIYGWEGRFIRMYVHPLFQTRSLEASSDDGVTWAPFIEGFPSNFGLHYPNGLTMIDGRVVVQNDPFLGWFEEPGTFYSLGEDDLAYQQESSLGVVMSTVLDISGSSFSDVYVTTLGSGIYTNAAPLSIGKAQQKVESGFLYPNTTESFFQIKGDLDIERVLIFNSTGKLVASEGTFGTNTEQIDISHLPLGLYLVRVESAESIYSGRIVKVN
ncbi:MAG: T9SS type A sorting domain-containing protein [Bacteroidota bacterium]